LKNSPAVLPKSFGGEARAGREIIRTSSEINMTVFLQNHGNFNPNKLAQQIKETFNPKLSQSL